MPDADFQDYTVYEVELDDPVVSADGRLISYSGIHRRLENGDLTVVNAASNHSDTSVPHSYAVSYEYGTPLSQTHGTDVIENVRTDTITNTRTDGIVLTLYDMHTKEPLAEGRFTLTQGDTLLGTFISDSQGRITVFYDFERNMDYTLTETQPPPNYIGLPHPAVFSIGTDNTVTITGNEPQWQNGRKSDITGDNLIAYIDVYNKPFTLTALKVDSVTDEVLSGAHFALYRSVNGIDGSVKDLEPIPDYTDLVTDENGVIPKIDRTLPSGQYYLTEISPPPDHDAHKEDIIFTVFPNGIISIDSIGHSEYLTIEGTDECHYLLKIPNALQQPVELTITKTVTGAFGDKTKDFTFILSVEDAEPADEYFWSKNDIPQDEPLHNNAAFTLKHGDSVKIMLPVNADITVREYNEDYTTSFRLNDTPSTAGNIKTFLLSEDSTLTVTNHLRAVIPTGVFHTAAGTSIFIMAAFFLVVFIVILIRIHHRKGLTA